MCTDMRECYHTCPCMHVEFRKQPLLLALTSYLILRQVSIVFLLHVLCWLDCGVLEIPLSSPRIYHRHVGLANVCALFVLLYVCSGDVNLGAQAYMASTLLH